MHHKMFRVHQNFSCNYNFIKSNVSKQNRFIEYYNINAEVRDSFKSEYSDWEIKEIL